MCIYESLHGEMPTETICINGCKQCSFNVPDIKRPRKIEYSEIPLPVVEGKYPPLHEMYFENGEWKHRWHYPEPDPDYKDPEMIETDTYYLADKEEYYYYPTVCKACGTQFQAHDKEEKNVRNYCPGCGKRLE